MTNGARKSFVQLTVSRGTLFIFRGSIGDYLRPSKRVQQTSLPSLFTLSLILFAAVQSAMLLFSSNCKFVVAKIIGKTTSNTVQSSTYLNKGSSYSAHVFFDLHFGLHAVHALGDRTSSTFQPTTFLTVIYVKVSSWYCWAKTYHLRGDYN